MAAHPNTSGPEGQDGPADDRQARVSRIVQAFLGLVALALTLYGGWLVADAARFAGVARPATGTVVSVETVTTQQTGNEGISFVPTIRYETPDGTVHEAPTHVSSSGYDFPIGARIAILYDPTAPGEVRTAGVFSLWGLPVAFLAAGLVLLGLIVASMLGVFGRKDGARA